jgi:hypothetical protein
MFSTKSSTFNGISRDARDIDLAGEEISMVAQKNQRLSQAACQHHQHRHAIDPQHW